MLFVSLLVAAVSVFMVFAGRKMIRTRRTPAKRLEKVFADSDGYVHGGMAVVKGYIFLIGGAVLFLMCVGIFFLSIYILIFGPINLGS